MRTRQKVMPGFSSLGVFPSAVVLRPFRCDAAAPCNYFAIHLYPSASVSYFPGGAFALNSHTLNHNLKRNASDTDCPLSH